MQSLKVFMITPELSPWAKVGGLGDVLGALPKELSVLGHDVRIVCPLYGCVEKDDDWSLHKPILTLSLDRSKLQCRVWETRLPNSSVKAYFLEYEEFFGHPEVYAGPSGDHSDNYRRFTFLCRACLDLCPFLDWIPDVIHCHDWTTGLVPVFLDTTDLDGPLKTISTVMTVHSLQHQGLCNPRILDFAHLPSRLLRASGIVSEGTVNLLRGGIYYSNKVTTVSPTYAREILEPELGCGLDQVLRARSDDLIGVLNGIDTKEWDPKSDKLLPARYDKDKMEGKLTCRAALQKSFRLKAADDIPIFGVVSRLYDQKGIDLLNAIIPRLVTEENLQIIIVGSGEPALEAALRRNSKRYAGTISVHIGFNDAMAHLVFAGSDFLVMPSRFEPCGLSQMYAMTYGCPPVARATGGLIDTVEPYLESKNKLKSTGILFDKPTEQDLYAAIGQACSIFRNRPKEYNKMQSNGMEKNFSWQNSAITYENIYQDAINSRLAAINI